MPAAGIENTQGAEVSRTRRFAGSALHRSAVGDRYPEPDPRNRRQGRDIGAKRRPYCVLDRESEWPDRKSQWLVAWVQITAQVDTYLLPIDSCPAFCPNRCSPRGCGGLVASVTGQETQSGAGYVLFLTVAPAWGISCRVRWK